VINVTKTYLPPLKSYKAYLEKIWDKSWVTNRGPLVCELEDELVKYLGVPNMLFVSNGTIAIQIAIKALELKGEIITTPFSYVATCTSVIWENCTPVFVDIESKTFCIDPDKIEEAITEKTTGILATHVYGYPCDVKGIAKIAEKHNLKVIYDAAHAFGTKLHGESILNSGDISTLSFHATKLFHTIEGGGIVVNGIDKASLVKKIFLYHAFGHIGDEYYSVGINGKNSEFHAAMGLCNLPGIKEVIAKRKMITDLYEANLPGNKIVRPLLKNGVEYNYAYFPIVFESDLVLLKVRSKLADNNINTRRYFFPSLNKLSYLQGSHCPVSEDIAGRVLCLPLYHELDPKIVLEICGLINKVI
jgi:dTDP-4-amino-4,6-dideoxygalactose transaminase